MKLTFDEIKKYTRGAEQVLNTPQGIRFLRFTQEELAAYETNPLKDKCLSAAGIRITFTTDASAVGLALTVTDRGSSRSYFSVEVQADGKRAGAIRNYTDEMDVETLKLCCPGGDFAQRFPLEAGEKTLEIYLPWSREMLLKDLTLEGATFCRPLEKRPILLMYGDSITHGYDAAYPSESYSNRLADALGMEVFNKAIGGETFFPALAECAPAQAPQMITVAYGSNDWKKKSREELLTNARLFLTALSERHPHTPIFLMTPLWRKDQEPYLYGEFPLVTEDLKAIGAEYPNITVLVGLDLVPKDPALFFDGRLHPNSAGFAHYAKNLKEAIQCSLQKK